MLHTIELVLLLELVELLLRLVQLLLAERCGYTGAPGCLVSQLVELPLRAIAFLRALEIVQLFALGECVEWLLLGPWRPRWSERVGRRPAGGKSQQHSGQQETYRHGPESLHRCTSLGGWVNNPMLCMGC